MITLPVLAQPGSTGVTIQIGADASAAYSNLINPVGFSVDSRSNITNNGAISLGGGAGSGGNRGAVLLGRDSANTLLNTAQGRINTTGVFNDGMAANGPNNVLINYGSISTSGPSAFGMTAAWLLSAGQLSNTLVNAGTIQTGGSNARGMSILGSDGVIVNNGTLSTTGNSSTAILLQGNNGSITNSGTIRTSGAGASAVFTNTVGSAFVTRIENQVGGQIISEQDLAVRTLNGATTLVNAGLLQGGAGTAVAMGANRNIVILQTGSRIVGAVDGGGNAATQLVLQGSGSSDNAFVRFAQLQMEGADWAWNGTGVFNTVTIGEGVLRLHGTLGGNTTVAAHATLAGTGTLLGDLLNQGNVRPGAGNGTGQLSIVGNYAGTGGAITVDSVLGTDPSPAGKLVVHGGTLAGSTKIHVNNLAGGGGMTMGNGILLVHAADGATSSSDAFALAGGSVSAGAYTYFLFKGGIEAINSDNWYLRSSALDLPGEDFPLFPDELPDEYQDKYPLPPELIPGRPKPLYRPEVSIYAEIPALVRQLGFDQIGAFYDRQGQPGLRSAGVLLPTAWARTWGGRATQSEAGTVAPAFDGGTGGVQVGKALYAQTTAGGGQNHVGVFFGFARFSGDVYGFALGRPHRFTGSATANAYSLGGYWTQWTAAGAYADLVLQASRLVVDSRSVRGIVAETRGSAWTASIEGGWPVPVAEGITLQPQAQLAWQHASLDGFTDSVSQVAINTHNSLLGRIGLRLQGNFEGYGALWRPYLQADALRIFGGEDHVVLGNTDIRTEQEQTLGRVSVGAVVEFGKSFYLDFKASYASSLGGAYVRASSGEFRGRWLW